MPTESTPHVDPVLPDAASPALSDLFAGLIDDAAALLPGADGAAVVEAHLARRSGPDTDILGPLAWPADRIDDLARIVVDASDTALEVVLVADGTADDIDDPWQLAVAARQRIDGPRREVVGIEVTPRRDAGGTGSDRLGLDVATFVRRVQATHAGDLPVWVELPRHGWEAAMEALGQAGPGSPVHAKWRLTEDGPDAVELATFLQGAIDHDVTVTLSGGLDEVIGDGSPGNHGFCAVASAFAVALGGGEDEEISQALAEEEPTTAIAAVRRIDEANASLVRAYWSSFASTDVSRPLAAARRSGLLPGS